MQELLPTCNHRETLAVYKESPLKQGLYFHSITEIGNLHRLWFKINKSNSTKYRFVEFNKNLYANLQIIQQRLRNNSFEFGPYQFFKIKEKKMRSIANAPLKDRVVHWLIYTHLQKYWMKHFIYDTYGNLPKKGTHSAVKRLSEWTRKPSLKYSLQMDISKYFFSINHEYLTKILIQHESEQSIRNLLINLINSYQTNSEHDSLFDMDSPYLSTINKGMPLGNLTSQFFANIYLNEFDHYVKEQLQIKHYIRYVDDIIILSDDKAKLIQSHQQLTSKLLTFGLTANPLKTSIRQISQGIPFLGFIIWPNHISVGKYIRKNYSKMLVKSPGKLTRLTQASYNGIFTHTGATR